MRGQVDGVNNGTSEPATPGYTMFCPMHEDDDVNSVDLGEPKGKEKEEECIKVHTKELQREKQALLREKQAVEDSF